MMTRVPTVCPARFARLPLARMGYASGYFTEPPELDVSCRVRHARWTIPHRLARTSVVRHPVAAARCSAHR